MAFDVPESGDDFEAVVDRVVAAALAQYLPAFEPGGDVFDAGPDPAMHPVVVVADDPGRCCRGTGVVIDVMLVSAVAEDDASIEALHLGGAGHDDVVVVSRASSGRLTPHGAGER